MRVPGRINARYRTRHFHRRAAAREVYCFFMRASGPRPMEMRVGKGSEPFYPICHNEDESGRQGSLWRFEELGRYIKFASLLHLVTDWLVAVARAESRR